MKISEKEKKIIIQKTAFLERKGYISNIKDYWIEYRKEELAFKVCYEPYGQNCDINIKFMNANKVYSIGWIAYIRSGIKRDPYNNLNSVLILVEYLKNNYDDIVKQSYCEESERLVNKYINNVF